MKLTLVIFFASVAVSLGNVNAQLINLNQVNVPLKRVLIDISKQSGYTFTYDDRDLNVSHSISIQKRQANITEALDALLSNLPLDYQIRDKSIAIFRKEVKKTATKSQTQPEVEQQARTITGVIKDINGELLSGVSVRLKGTNIGVSSSEQGMFSIDVQKENATLIFSSLGFVSKEISIGTNFRIEVILETAYGGLDEVVVTALGIKREQKALGYAVQKVGGTELSTAKGVDFATSLTGKVAGLNIKNSTEFNTTPSIELRGQSPLIVIDGVATQFVSLRDIPADDIEDITVLKGATASALYGSRGGAGAIMITTKKSKSKGLDVQINSSTMTDAGYLVKPEVQSSYSTGQGGIYQAGSYVWGDKLDIGRTAIIHDPFTFEKKETVLVSKGKDNLKNFQRSSLITNNNISISQRGENGGVRASLTHVFNQGQYEGNKLNKLTYAINGDMKAGKFSFDGGINYNKRFYPNMGATGYGGGGILYNLNVWSGTEYDIRDYKNYWELVDEKQNWMDNSWYDNPYFIVNEIRHSNDYNVLNGYFNTAFETTDWLTLNVRVGADMFSQLDKWRNPVGAIGGWNKLGYFSTQRQGGYSVNGDFMATAKKNVGDFYLEGFVGAGLNYRNNDSQSGTTQGGLSVPGFYSLKASVSPALTSSSLTRRQDNSIYGRFSASWKNAVFLEVTGRNDWSSTLDKNNRSFFYPSVSSSVVLSDLITLPEEISMWKVRGSWTQTKFAPGIYSINQQYIITSDVWQGYGTASYPDIMRNSSIKPVTTDSWEIGTGWNLFGNRMDIDFTYYDMLTYNQQRDATISSASGFNKTQININEDLRRRGVEIMVGGEIIKKDDFSWKSRINWSRSRYTYDKIDSDYSTDKPWVTNGARWDWVGVYDWERDPQGNIIHYGGLPRRSSYETVAGFSGANFIWGWSNSFKYKMLELNLSFDGRVGGTAHSVTDQAMWNSGSHPDSDNEHRYDMVVNGKKNYVGNGVKVVSGSVDYDSYGNIVRDDRVFESNDTPVSYETYAVQMAPYIGSPSSQFMFSQTFIKLRDISLTYSLPSAVASKFKARNASVSFIGQNLWMWAKDFKYSDPDVGSDNLNSASIRYIGANIKLQF
ncbi:SusC/RagA family TonB-linked outer membrane protein [Sphingobacterium sp. UT-1RO-CII-1]|uniref:SusC/RagA family TonB-linked outer membrane protein n=1 Tax=Sphingobacterium sp. UT-1RO-CII-1 TaxID=2995225 RepID=UPI00227A9F62|nr:SusC/RagA family TonB-linked outer membrane protein [Sphingobacterium sp. UT-1RO-CII-1]MCY4780261.1 SusC/RagA family TonB-linked outer membrane protein [Sphingobacterium sp. UT-1RO-CII-1]